MICLKRLFVIQLLILLIAVACSNTSNSGNNVKNEETNTPDEVKESKSDAFVPGVTDETITLGMLNDFSGGAVYLGAGGMDGYEAYVQYINENGGIHGRKIELISEDNQYTPAGGVDGAKKLIELENVFAIPYSFGTGPTVAIKDYINEQGVPVLGLGEGTEFFEPASKYLFGVGTPYSYQGGIAVRYVAENLEVGNETKIAFMGQDDAYGKDSFSGVDIAIQHYDNVDLVFEEYHSRDQANFGDQVLQLKNSDAEYLFITSSVERAGMIVKELVEQNVDLKGVFSLSFGSIDNRIFEIGGNDFIGKYYGIQSFYSWDQTDQEKVQFVIDILKEQGKEDVIEEKNNFFWYAWNNMSIFVKALELAGENLTRDGTIEALESFDGSVETLATLPEVTYGPDKRITGSEAFVTKAELDSNGEIVWTLETDFLRAPDVVLEQLGY